MSKSNLTCLLKYFFMIDLIQHLETKNKNGLLPQINTKKKQIKMIDVLAGSEVTKKTICITLLIVSHNFSKFMRSN